MREYKSIRKLLTERMPPPTMKMATELAEAARKWLDDVIHSPARVERRIQADVEEKLQELAQRRARACDEAVQDGLFLYQLQIQTGEKFWRYLVMMGRSRRTAENLVALANLAAKCPDLFERLKVLGPTKLYRIARLPDPVLRTLDPDRKIRIPRGEVKLRHLTDRELESYLRTVCPVRRRKYASRVRAFLERLSLDFDGDGGAPVSRDELLSLRNRLKTLLGQIDRTLERAA